MKVMLYLNEKISQNIIQLSRCIVTKCEKIKDIEYVHCGYDGAAQIPQNGWEKFDTETCFTSTDDHYWFKMIVETPTVDENSVVCFKLNTGRENQWQPTNPQGLLYIDGHPTQALDTNHTTVLLEGGKRVELCCYYYTGMENVKSYFIPEIIVKNKLVEKLYYDVLVPFETSKLYENNKDKNDIVIFDAFYRTNPCGGGYAISAGLEQVIDYIHGPAAVIRFDLIAEVYQAH